MKSRVMKTWCRETPTAPQSLGVVAWGPALPGGDADAGGERSPESRAGGWWMLTLPEELFSLLMRRERRHSQCICGI